MNETKTNQAKFCRSTLLTTSSAQCTLTLKTMKTTTDIKREKKGGGGGKTMQTHANTKLKRKEKR